MSMVYFAEAREKLYYLPEATPDFIFPITWEEQVIFTALLILTVLLFSVGIRRFLRRRRK